MIQNKKEISNFKITSLKNRHVGERCFIVAPGPSLDVNDVEKLRDISWKRIRMPQNLLGMIKVRVNHIGQIVSVGEY